MGIPSDRQLIYRKKIDCAVVLGCSQKYKEPAKVNLYEIFESEFKLFPDQQFLIIGTKNADQLQKWAEKSLVGIE